MEITICGRTFHQLSGTAVFKLVRGLLTCRTVINGFQEKIHQIFSRRRMYVEKTDSMGKFAKRHSSLVLFCKDNHCYMRLCYNEAG